MKVILVFALLLVGCGQSSDRGRFVIVLNENNFICKLDTATGKSWLWDGSGWSEIQTALEPYPKK